MGNNNTENQRRHNSLVSLCAFCEFYYNLTFRQRVDMGLGIVCISINSHPDDLMTLSDEALDNRIKSIEKPWWHDMYEDIKDEPKILVILMKRGYALQDLKKLHKLWKKGDMEKIDYIYLTTMRRSKFLGVFNMRWIHLFIDCISSWKKVNYRSRNMNIFEKLFRKKAKKSNTTENSGFQIGAIKEYFEKQYQVIAEQCQNDIIKYHSARSIFRHYPLRYDPNNTFPEEINEVMDKIFKTLYDYCIKKEIIASDITYEDFYKGKGLYDESYPMDEWLSKFKDKQ